VSPHCLIAPLLGIRALKSGAYKEVIGHLTEEVKRDFVGGKRWLSTILNIHNLHLLCGQP
jgi:hypothetical protein